MIFRSDPVVGMRVGGTTSGPRAAFKGMKQIREINRELGITEWTYLRYIRKILKRIKGARDLGGVADVEQLLSRRGTPQNLKVD